RSLQTKRSGLAFADVDLVVKLGTCGPWLRELDQRWPDGPEELEADFAEGYTVEHADVQIITPRDRVDLVRGMGWSLRNNALVEPAGTAPGDIAWLGQAYETILRTRSQQSTVPATADCPLVTVAVSHYNLGRYLPETLAALAAQTYSHLEVLV